MLPKVMMEESRMARGKASGTSTALWYQMNSNRTLVLIPFPTKSSTHNQKNCINKTSTVIKKVAMKGPMKALNTNMSNFLTTAAFNNFSYGSFKNTPFKR